MPPVSGGQCAQRRKHRRAQAKHVKKIGAAKQRERVKKSYRKHKDKVLARKKRHEKAVRSGRVARKRSIGRPRLC